MNNEVVRKCMTLKWKTIVFEDLPIKLTQQEERVLRWIVAPKSDKKRARRRSAIWVIAKYRLGRSSSPS